MRTHEDIYKANQDYRNRLRRAEYELRKAEFIQKYCYAPDPDYTAYYGADMAAWIDAVQTFDITVNDKKEWWEYQNEDEDWIKQQDTPYFLKHQAF